MKYQPEIDGLRALSVLAVLFYHLGVKWVPGGFTGVDVFFVISGFLITVIIKKNIDEYGDFSFLDFYARRIRRIFPALIAVLLVTTVAGYFFLDPGHYESQSRSVIAAALSVSNIYFFLNTGYFDNTSEMLPLLHTWSLGVEEQFYLFLPILLVWLSKKQRKYIFPILFTCVIAIFFMSARMVYIDQKSAFYLTYYRAWELGAGALLAYLPKSNFSLMSKSAVRLLPLLGLLLIGYSLFSFHSINNFPGYGSLASVTGAILILAYVGQRNIVNRALSFRPLVFAGKISYSLYLWHWPLVVYWRHYTSGAEMTIVEQFIIGIISIVLGYLSWKWIETPFRYAKAGHKKSVILGVCAMLVVSVPSVLIINMSGMAHRLSDEHLVMQSKEQMWSWACPEELKISGIYMCNVGLPWNSSGEKALIVGDSHAQHLLPLLHEAGLQKNMSIAFFGSCPPIYRSEVGGLLHFDHTYLKGCYKSRADLFELLAINKNVKTVILAGIWPAIGFSVYKEQSELDNVIHSLSTGDSVSRLKAFVKGSNYIATEIKILANELEKKGIRLVIVSDIPAFKGRDPVSCFLAKSTTLIRRPCGDSGEQVSRDEMKAYQIPMAEILRKLRQGNPNIQVVIPTDYLCRTETCIAYVDGVYIYRDTDHLRRNMPKEVYSKLSDRIGLTSALELNRTTK